MHFFVGHFLVQQVVVHGPVRCCFLLQAVMQIMQFCAYHADFLSSLFQYRSATNGRGFATSCLPFHPYHPCLPFHPCLPCRGRDGHGRLHLPSPWESR